MELDQMASMFRSAWKQGYQYSPPQLKKIVLITDKDRNKSAQILDNVKSYLSVLNDDPPEWEVVCKDDYHSVTALIERCQDWQADLIVSYRHLWNNEKGLHHSIGVYLDMLTQTTDIPVLVLPHLEDKNYAQVLQNTNEVMVITDHMAEEQSMIDYAVRLTENKGKLFLAHVEHMHVYKRYIDAISKISELNTDVAQEKIAHQLLKEPREFIAKIVEALEEGEINLEIIPLVTFGHTVKTYGELMKKHKIDLLILHTKDGDQLAMQGDAYSIAVEFTDIPLLLM